MNWFNIAQEGANEKFIYDLNNFNTKNSVNVISESNDIPLFH